MTSIKTTEIAKKSYNNGVTLKFFGMIIWHDHALLDMIATQLVNQLEGLALFLL